MSSGKKSALQSAMILSLSSIGLQLLGFVYRVFISRMTGAEGMGVFSLVMPVYSIMLSFAMSGLGTAVTALSSGQAALGDTAGTGRLMRFALTLVCALFLVVAVPTVLFSGWISENLLGNADTRPALLILLPCLLLTGFENIFKSWFYGVKSVKTPAFSDQMEQIVRIAAVAALLLWMRPESPAAAAALIVGGMTVSELFSSTFLAVRYMRSHPRPRPSSPPARPGLIGKVLALALPVSASAVAGNLLSSANTVLMPRRLMAAGVAPGEAVGALGVLHGMAMPLFMLPMAFIGPLIMVALPRLSESAALHNASDIRRKAGKALHATGLIALPPLAVLAPMGPEVCRLLFGQELSIVYFLGLAGASAFAYYQAVTNGIMNGIGLQKRAMVDSIAGGLLQLAVTWFAVADPALGIYGYMLGMAAGSLLTVALNMLSMVRKGIVRIGWARWIAMPLLSAAASGLAAANAGMFAEYAGLGQIASLACQAAAGAACCLLCVRLQGIFPGKYVKQLLSSFRLSTPRNPVSSSMF